jgi:hypothetical protein
MVKVSRLSKDTMFVSGLLIGIVIGVFITMLIVLAISAMS